MGREDTIVYYDDSCGLCEKIFLHLNSRGGIRFSGFSTMVSGDSSGDCFYNQQMLLEDSVVYVNGDNVKYKSDAIVAIGSDLGGIYKLLKLLYLVPRSLRDGVYDLVARNRRRYGRHFF